MIQVRGAHPAALRAVYQALGLVARGRSDSVAERAVAKRHFQRLVMQHDLCRGRVTVPAHPLGCRDVGECLVVGSTFVPWWRGYLAWAVAEHCGFRDDGGPTARPWRLVGGGGWGFKLFGVRRSVLDVHAFYAVAELFAVRQLRQVPPEHADEYLAGVAMGISAGLRQQREWAIPRTAMVVRAHADAEDSPVESAPPSPLDRYLAAAVQDPTHPLSRGFVRAKREDLAGQVLGRRRASFTELVRHWLG